MDIAQALRRFLSLEGVQAVHIKRKHIPKYGKLGIDHSGQMSFVLGWGDGSLATWAAHQKHCWAKNWIFLCHESERGQVAAWCDGGNVSESGGILPHVVWLNDDPLPVLREWILQFTACSNMIPAASACDIISEHWVPDRLLVWRAGIRNLLPSILSASCNRPGNSSDDSWSGLANVFRNAKLALRGRDTSHLRGCLGDAPILVVGSGPSLHGCLDELRRLQGRAWIFAAMSAAAPLMEEGIYPDIVFPVERLEHTNEYMEEIAARASGHNLYHAGPPVIPHNAYKSLGADRILTSLGPEVVYDMLIPDGVMHSRNFIGITSGIASISFAAMMSRNIILIGHDLAFHGGSPYWEKTRSLYGALPSLDDAIIPVEGWDGRSLATTRIWSQGITELQNMVAEYGRLFGTRFRSVGVALGMGARINGVTGINLSEVQHKRVFDHLGSCQPIDAGWHNSFLVSLNNVPDVLSGYRQMLSDAHARVSEMQCAMHRKAVSWGEVLEAARRVGVMPEKHTNLAKSIIMYLFHPYFIAVGKRLHASRRTRSSALAVANVLHYLEICAHDLMVGVDTYAKRIIAAAQAAQSD